MVSTLTTVCANKTAIACVIHGPGNETDLVLSSGRLYVNEPVHLLQSLPDNVASVFIEDNSELSAISSTFSTSPLLTELSLRYNHLDSSLNNVQWPPGLLELSLSTNKIEAVDGWRIPSTLVTLNLDFNTINNFNVDAASFAALSQMSVYATVAIRSLDCKGTVQSFAGAPDPKTKATFKHQICVVSVAKAADSPSSSTGVYVGVGVGVAVLVLIIAILVLRRRRGKALMDATPPTTIRATFQQFHEQQQREVTASSKASDGTFAYAYDIRSDADLSAFRIPKRELLDKRVCGSGGFAIVYEARFQDRVVAVKELQAVHTRHATHIQAFMHEIKTFSTLDHPNVVAFVGVSWTTLHDLALVTEFLPRGDLRDLLASDLGPQQLSWTTPATTIPTTKLQIAVHVVDALTYLHSFEPKLLHRDLKSRNVLLAADWTAMLTDFGISREMADETMTSEAGTTAWMAPEVLTNQGRYNEKADVYSFGVVLSELDTWKVPYADASRTAVQTALLVSTGKLQPDFRPDCPPVIHDLAIQCLAMDPSARPTAAQAAYALRKYLREGPMVLTTQCGSKTAILCIKDSTGATKALSPDSSGSITIDERLDVLQSLAPQRELTQERSHLDGGGISLVNPLLGVKIASTAPLTYLSLQNSNLDASVNIVQWPPSLTTLDLSGNRIGTLNASFVIPSKLRTLDLSSNKMTIVDGLEIPMSLRSLSMATRFTVTGLSSSLAGNAIRMFNVNSATFTSLSEMDVYSDTAFEAQNCDGGLRTFRGAPDPTTNAVLIHTVCVTGGAIPMSSGSGGASPGLYVGIGVGVGAVLALVAYLIFRRRQQSPAAVGNYHSLDTPPFKFSKQGTFERHHNQQELAIVASAATTTTTTFTYDIRTDADLESCRIPKRELLDKRVCGSGGFAVVYQATLQDKLVAIKELQAVHARRTPYIQAFMHEIKTFSTLDHPNVVAFVGVSWTTLHDLALVTEFLPRGDLRDLLASDLGPQQLSWTTPATTIPTTKLQIAVHVVDALTYLHSFEPKLLHRDLKSRNVLLAADWTAKLTDFGISREMADETMTSEAGTTAWMAPEVLTNQGRYNEKADVYSFGVVLSELDTWKVPYADASGGSGSGMSSVQTALLVSTGKLKPSFRPDCPQVVLAIALRCLAMDPSDRPTASQVAYELRKYLRTLTAGQPSRMALEKH
ncbi:protein kinase [Achlya hypogyna]|uniref:Protein kinase n=1 Tax=Achlya hypogyna TaxID=1202772 RepID=A0A1V9ZFP9_ACHHY|nr:protein kinase [Achlya hypogyna]